MKYHIIGIRPGEKLHEVLCPEDSAKDTIEFKDKSIDNMEIVQEEKDKSIEETDIEDVPN